MAGTDSGYTIEAPDAGFTVEAPDYEAQAAANPPIHYGQPIPETSPVRRAPVDRNAPNPNVKVLNLNPWDFGTYTHEPISYNEYERESGRDIATIAGAMATGGLVPKGWGAVGKYLAKPVVSGVGAGVGNLIGGGTPSEAMQAGTSTAAGEMLFGGLAAGAKGLIRSGMLGEGMANYFSEATGGKLIPTDEARDLQRIHEAIGVKSGDMNIGLGASTPQDAWNLPGRAIKEAGFKPQDFEGLNPFEQAEKLKPYWVKAGQAVADTAAKATKDGVKFDGAKSLTQAIGDMLDPEGSKALKLANDTAEQLGIKDWRKMTPTQAVELKQKLWDRLPPRFRGPVYGALTRDLNKAVPDMIPVNRTYSEFRSAMDAIEASTGKYMERAGPTQFQQMVQWMKQNPRISGPIGAVTGFGSMYSGYEGAKSLYNLMTNR